MPTTMKNNSWFPGDDDWVAEDDDGHRGSGASPEAAQEALEYAQDEGVEWITPLFAGPDV